MEVSDYQIDQQGVRDFLGNVFKQVDVDRFMTIYEEAVKKGSAKEIYDEMLQKAPTAQGGTISQMRMGLNALKQERGTLAANVAKVMDPLRAKDGYVEIGMPGRMIKGLTPLMGLKGRVTVVNEGESRIQSGFPRPYHDFHKLDYEPLKLTEKSVDVISSFAGLHHCPPEKLDAFIDSIHSTLRDGGVFLLREHDTHNEEMRKLAAVVHSVFNAATGVTAEDEAKEVRNFKGVEEWKTLLATHGFQCVSEPLVREGDSSQNALLKFVKVDNPADVIREKLISHKNNYTRPKEQTHLTQVEWFNVESSQNLGSEESFWNYPYFRDVGQLWKCFYQSLKQARHVKNLTSIAFSDYGVMNGMIVTMMSVEYLAKGVLFFPLWAASKLDHLLPNGKQDDTWATPALEYQKWLNTYGQKLEKTPYYAQSYVPEIKNYWSTLGTSWTEARKQRGVIDLTFDRQTLKNVLTGIAFNVDMLFRASLASVVNWVYGGEENGDERVISILLKGDDLPEASTLIQEEGNPYKGVIVPRYKDLEAYLKTCAEQNIEIVEIGGHTEIQIDLLVDKDDAIEDKLYERLYLPDPAKKIVSRKVPVANLPQIFKEHTLHRIYDF